MIIVNAKFSVKPEAREDFLNEINALIASSKQEESCLAYDLYESAATPNEFVMIENWATKENTEVHNTNPLLLAFAKNVANYVAAAPVLQIVEKKED